MRTPAALHLSPHVTVVSCRYLQALETLRVRAGRRRSVSQQVMFNMHMYVGDGHWTSRCVLKLELSRAWLKLRRDYSLTSSLFNVSSLHLER